MKKCFACLVGLVAFIVTSLHADIYHVSPNGGGKYPYRNWKDAAVTLQDAVDAAVKVGDDEAIVLVRKGVYKGTGVGPVVKIIRSLTLKSESADPADVIVDGEGKRRCILVTLEEKGAKVSFEGITIKNGFTDATNGCGAGIYIDHTKVNAGEVTIQRCVISDSSKTSP